MSRKMLINFSRPKPIIVAEKVPPKTIINAGKRKRALADPPSIKNAPKIDINPRMRPEKVPADLIIRNPGLIWEESSQIIYRKPGGDNPAAEDRLLLGQHQRSLLPQSNLLLQAFCCLGDLPYHSVGL